MTTGLLILILLTATGTTDAAGSLEELVARIAPDNGHSELQFREERSSPLLSEPLVVSGRLWRNARGQLVRRTVEPREATHTLTSGMVIIERPGQSPRNYSLSHIPELAVLYHGLTALLSGDAEALRAHFEHELTDDDEGWRLKLTPRDEAIAEQVESLSLSGQDDAFERFVLALTDGETITTELSRVQ